MTSTHYFSGRRGYLFSKEACAAGYPLLHGPYLHCDILHGDGGEVARPGVCQVLHQCLVLVRLRHSYGKNIAIVMVRT